MFGSSSNSGGGLFGGGGGGGDGGGLFGGGGGGGGGGKGATSLLGAVGAGGAAGAAGDALFGIAAPGLFETKCCCTMTKKQRLYGFIGCFCAGVFVSLISTVFIWTFNYTGFGICYSFGNVLAILSTLFIMGPWAQLKNMFHANRVVATCVYLGALVATLVVAFTVKDAGIFVLVLVGVQVVALFWYSLSYIPFGRQLLTRAVSGMCASAG